MNQNSPLLPRVHAAIRQNKFQQALELSEIGMERYYQSNVLIDVFRSKIDEIHRLTNSRPSNIHQNKETLVILGNGPSLKYVMGNQEYREVLKQYDTFGLNAAYRAYDELNFWPTYHGCLDMIVVESHLRSYQNILPKLTKMFLLAEDHLKNDIIDFDHPNLVKIRFDPRYRDSNDKILSDRFDEFRNWQNSGCNCVQIGFMLGYKKVVLLGMDANYKEVLTEASVVRDDKYKWDHLEITKDVSQNDNYWFPGYQQIGDKYNIPNAARYHLPAWNALGLSEHGVKVVNCSSETKITTIRRQSFEETFGVRPPYSYSPTVVELRAIGFSPERLQGCVIRFDGILYLLTRENSVYVRKFIPPQTLSARTGKGAFLDIYDVEERFMEFPCHGVVEHLSAENKLRPGLTFLIRARNEQSNIHFVLGSLKSILADAPLNCEVLFVDNRSDDGTYDEVLKTCRDVGIGNVLLTRYDVEVCPSGEQHTHLKQSGEMSRSLDTYYNWCLDRAQTYNIIKWDCDFLAIPENLLRMIRELDLSHTDRPLAIWCAGKTLFRKNDKFFVNERTMYNEFRVFSKLQGYRWEYAPRWEICSQSYMKSAAKHVFTPSVFLELKDIARNEFEFRSAGAAVVSDIRDARDAQIIASLKTDSVDKSSSGLTPLGFNPLVPEALFDSALANYECTLEELDAMQSYWLNVYSRPNDPIRFSNSGNVIVQGLWVGEEITDLHRLCVNSFIQNGHCFVLYTYGPVRNLPEGVVILDANKLVPASMIYQFDGSYAGFSDLFRNKLLHEKGGWYVDLDIFSVKRYDFSEDTILALDYYPEVSIPKYKKTGEIIQDRFYIQTNPVKLPAGTPLPLRMYEKIFRKIIGQKVKEEFWQDNPEVVISGIALQNILDKMEVSSEFNTHIGALPQEVTHYTLTSFLQHLKLTPKDLGQSTWGEIGPIMVTREAIASGLHVHAKKPEQLQGVIKYVEVEKFLDPAFDYTSELNKHDVYSIDLFFTMWRRRGLLEKTGTQERCLLNHLRGMYPL